MSNTSIADSFFDPRALISAQYDYNDGISEQLVNDMRIRAHQRALHAQREKSRKAKLTSASGADDDDVVKGPNDIMKKDMTTDHLGKIIQVKTVRTDKLPKMQPSNTHTTVS